MSLCHMTVDQIRQAIEAAKRSLDYKAIREDIDMQTAADHNTRRKVAMIDALYQLYAYLYSDGDAPTALASQKFNPYDGPDRTNIYYVFKELKKGMPWEIRRDYLVTPTALTLVMLDTANRLFPSPVVTDAMLTYQGFVNLWTLPRHRPEETEAQAAAKREDYMRKLANCEEKITAMYERLSAYFASIENPERDPVKKKIDETHTNAKKIAKKLKIKENEPALAAKKKALAIWEKNRHSITLAKKGQKTTYAFVFGKFRRRLERLGIRDAESFKKAIGTAQKTMRKPPKKTEKTA